MSRQLTGIAGSPGAVAGPAVIIASSSDIRDLHKTVTLDDVELAITTVGSELDRLAHTATGEAADILSAQAMMVRDPALAASMRATCQGGESAPAAFSQAINEFRSALAALGGYLGERAADLDDLERRVLATASGAQLDALPKTEQPHVLVARDLAPADTVGLDPGNVLAIITEQGGRTSHTSVVARGLGIPAVVGCPGALEIAPDSLVLVDGDEGTVVVDPTPQQLRSLPAIRSEATVPSERCATKDGERVELLANVSGSAEAERAAALGAEGVGLLRTELLYLHRQVAPTLEEQEREYLAVFEVFPTGKVVVRTLDAGADKPLPFLAHDAPEANPALGIRGWRLDVLGPKLFDDQLAAIAAASAKVNTRVAVMAPMVATAEEAAAFASRARAAGIEAAGSMVEVPAAALRAGQLLEHCDFLCIGTNDLSQYAFAADRGLAALSGLLDPWQPALLDLIRLTAAAGEAAGKLVSVCGEAASDPLMALVLVGLGVRSLSMSSGSLASVHEAIGRHDLEQCRDLAALAVGARSAEAGRAVVKAKAHWSGK
ncbi:MAG: phosphoenolpyruvate-protein phosphotransferase [Acidimicrobiaceae bacterium]|nr:phosphoenolpyruvate-protein phosphotransferase [Acidimicrobiaceae bacterium]